MQGRKKKQKRMDRYIGLYRAVNEAGIDSQRESVTTWAGKTGLILADEMSLVGVGATPSEIDPYVGQLIQRKVEHDDFDVIAMTDASRLTRGGVMHYMTIANAFEDVGVRLASVADSHTSQSQSVMVWQAAAADLAMQQVFSGNIAGSREAL